MTVSLPSLNRTLLIACVSFATLTGCSSLNDETPPAATPATSTSASQTPPEMARNDAALPADTAIAPAGDRTSWENCPYLDDEWVAQTNGQKVTGVALDPRFEIPACVYWSYPEEPQLTVLVRHMPTEQDAIAVVDHYAPVDVTNPAELPGGWMGGRAGQGVVPEQPGAVFAVSKDDYAVVVTTNQDQSVKAETVAQEVISNLGL
nr:DUF2020 domain-containing protein [Corynebacterium cystitidis]